MDINKSIQLAFEHYKTGDLQQAELLYKDILKKQPNNVDVLCLLGISSFQLGENDSAIKHFKKALELDPNLADAHYNLGIILQDKGQLDEAITCYQKAVQIDPAFALAYNNLGNAFQDKGQLDEAITYLRKAIQLDPNITDAYYNLGNCFRYKGQLDDAISCFQRALKLKPDLAEAYNNMGVAFMDQGKINEAISCHQKALQLKPDYTEAYRNMLYQLQQTCLWQELKAMTAKLDGLIRKALDNRTRPAETPFLNITRYADLSNNFAIAELWSNEISIAMSILKLHFSFDDRRTDKTKLVIGYLSSDFRNHAIAHLMLSLFGLHKRDAFEIFCYSYGKDDRSYYRDRIQHDCNKFVDISSLSYSDAAKCIYKDRVDILVDLKGYTWGNRLAICALRPAPIQVSYLYPGTTGADFFDYIITDKIVTPEDHAPYYSENFVYMPHCYLVNDHTQSISSKEWKREDFGLPESSFIFCSFNLPYKIDPVMFDIWMRILKQVQESVLWLLLDNKIAEENLRREAEARGVKSERLIFAEMLPKDEHLGRMRFANLALDTRIYNGHTTTSDSLWAGVPVITLQGAHFASRVSSSILTAIGLSELITHSLEEYEALSVRLANNTLELQEIRQRIATNRLKAPLFDTPRFVRNLETAYKEMWKIFLAGEAPRLIEVLES